MIDLASEQRGVARGALLAVLVAAMILALGWLSADRFFPALGDDGDRLSFAMRTDLALGLCLIVFTGRIANLRFRSVEDIGGSAALTESDAVRQGRAVLQNTLEQSAIALIAHTGLVLALPADRPAIIPALALLFVAGRICFAAGYARGAAARAFGFGLTFYPSVAAMVAAAVLTLTQM